MVRRSLTAFAFVAGLTAFCLPAYGGESAKQTGAVSAAREVEPPPPYKTAGKVSHAIQKYTGINFLANRMASAAATVAASAYMRGRASVKVRSYNFTDMLQGELRSVDINLKSGKYKGVPVGSLHARTITPFKLSYMPFGKRKRGLLTPVMVALDGRVSEKLVSKALRSKAVTENLRFLKLDLPGLGEQHLQVLEPRVDVKGEKVQVNAHLITAGAEKETGIELSISARPQLEKERFIVLKDIEIQSADIQNPRSFAAFAEELLNPLIDFGRMDRHTHAFRMQELQVADDRVKFTGRLLLAPKPAPPAQSPVGALLPGKRP